jgi:hypothetical protein
MADNVKIKCKICEKEFELEISQRIFDWLKGYINFDSDWDMSLSEYNAHQKAYKEAFLSENSQNLMYNEWCSKCTNEYSVERNFAETLNNRVNNQLQRLVNARQIAQAQQ